MLILIWQKSASPLSSVTATGSGQLDDVVLPKHGVDIRQQLRQWQEENGAGNENISLPFEPEVTDDRNESMRSFRLVENAIETDQSEASPPYSESSTNNSKETEADQTNEHEDAEDMLPGMFIAVE